MKRFLKKHVIEIVLSIVLFAGLCLILYPTVSDWWNSFHQSRAIASYVETVDEMSEEEQREMLAAARAYNEKLAAGNGGFLLGEREQQEYESLLDVSGTGIMGYIQIPSLGVSLPVYHGTEEAVLQVAIGHIPGSSLPVGGESTHCLVSGHRGLPSARLFTDLDQMEEGDVFTLTVLGQTITYQVDQIRVVLPEEQEELRITEGEDYCTLITCTPYGINSHRILVRGTRVRNLEDTYTITAEAVKLPVYRVVLAVGAPVVLLTLLGIWIFRRIRRPKKSMKELLEDLREDEKKDDVS